MDDSVNRLISSAGSNSPIAEEESDVIGSEDVNENTNSSETVKGGKLNNCKRVARKVASDKPVKAKKEPTKRAPRKTATPAKAKAKKGCDESGKADHTNSMVTESTSEHEPEVAVESDCEAVNDEMKSPSKAVISSENNDEVVVSVQSPSDISPVSKQSSRASKLKKEAKLAAPKKEAPPAFEELPEETQARINNCTTQITKALQDLQQEEEDIGLADNDRETDASVNALVNMVKNADNYVSETEAAIAAAKKAATSTGTTTTDEADDPTKKKEIDMEIELEIEAPETRLEHAIKTIIARATDGRSDPLAMLSISVSSILGRAQQLLHHTVSEEDISELVSCYRSMSMQALENLQMNAGGELDEEIKSLACREAYGTKAEKGTDPYQDATDSSMWRWDVVLASKYFSKAGQAMAREAKVNRKRYGVLVRALLKLKEQLAKTRSMDIAKVELCESSVTKAYSEISAASKRRKDAELKKKAMLEEKARKDAEVMKKKKITELEKEQAKAAKEAEILMKKEEQTRIKGEAARLKEIAKQEAAAEKARIAEEKSLEKERMKRLKEEEEAAKIAKNKKQMLGFFSAPAPVTTTPSCKKLIPLVSQSTSPKIAQGASATTGVVDLTNTPPDGGSDSWCHHGCGCTYTQYNYRVRY
jgi:hypothetical protein